jgi:hypothetical protein
MPSRYYIFCRFWHGFGHKFPFDRFVTIPSGDAILNAVGEAVRTELTTNAVAEFTWRASLLRKVGLNHLDDNSAQTRQMNAWLDGYLRGPGLPQHAGGVVPDKPVPLHVEVFGYALFVIGWGTMMQAVSINDIAGEYVIAATELEAHAIEVVERLNEWGGGGWNEHTARFWHVQADTLKLVERAEIEDELDLLRECGFGRHVPMGRAEGDRRMYSREALALLDKMRSIGDAEQQATAKDLALTVPAAVPSDDTGVNLYSFKLVGQSWQILFAKERGYFPDSLGFQMVARLLRAPNHPMTAAEALGKEGWVSELSFGEDLDVDEEGLAAMQEQLDHLSEDLRLATQRGATARVAELQRAQKVLPAAIERAKATLKYGSDGQGSSRRTSGMAKSAQVSATSARKRFLIAIQPSMPNCHDHFKAALELGRECSYKPSTPLPWEI